MRLLFLLKKIHMYSAVEDTGSGYIQSFFGHMGPPDLLQMPGHRSFRRTNCRAAGCVPRLTLRISVCSFLGSKLAMTNARGACPNLDKLMVWCVEFQTVR